MYVFFPSVQVQGVQHKVEEGKGPLRKDVVRWCNQNKFHVKKMIGSALGLSTEHLFV